MYNYFAEEFPSHDGRFCLSIKRQGKLGAARMSEIPSQKTFETIHRGSSLLLSLHLAPDDHLPYAHLSYTFLIYPTPALDIMRKLHKTQLQPD